MKQSPESVPLNIFLADDDRDDRFFFEKALEEIHVTAHLKKIINGERLMEYLTMHPEALPDILFLDINMPRKNGAECLKEIKTNPKLKGIPVVIYSTSLQDEVIDVFYRQGAHYYLKKCNFNELKKAIRTVLKLLEKNHAQPAKEEFIIDIEV